MGPRRKQKTKGGGGIQFAGKRKAPDANSSSRGNEEGRVCQTPVGKKKVHKKTDGGKTQGRSVEQNEPKKGMEKLTARTQQEVQGGGGQNGV